MKVTIISASVSRRAGGLLPSLQRLSQTLAEGSEMEVHVAGLKDPDTENDLVGWSPLRPRVFDPWPPRVLGYSPELRDHLLGSGSDLLHNHGLWLYPSAAVLRCHRETRRPYLVTPHGMLDPWALDHSGWKKRIAEILFEDEHLRSASCLHALCESEASSIRAYGLKNPICIIPNGVDLPQLVERSELSVGSSVHRPSTITHQLKLDGRKVLLYLGRIHPKKGLINLFEAWKHALNHQPSTINLWLLAIAGWDQGGHEQELKRLATELGITWADLRDQRSEGRTQSAKPSSALRPQASVVFLGPQFGPDKEACYRNCDAFILPSLSEGLPMVVLEAWAYGKPVLMTPECNLPEGFAAGAAIRIEPGAESITQGLQELFRTPHSALRTLGDNGRLLVAEKFTWPKIARDMRDVYAWVLGGGAKPTCVVES